MRVRVRVRVRVRLALIYLCSLIFLLPYIDIYFVIFSLSSLVFGCGRVVPCLVYVSSCFFAALFFAGFVVSWS